MAPTSFSPAETEESIVGAVLNGGFQIELKNPLAFEHLGETRFFGGRPVELRAEVGLLTHNVVVQGDDTSDAPNQYGAHVLIGGGPERAVARLENVELFRMWQAFRLGRYPIHFHMQNAMQESYVRSCSAHRTFNRAFAIHGTHFVTLEANVAYDTMGHTFFLEDGIESNNRIVNNFGLLTKPSIALLNTDQSPATFWITNPNNEFVGNVAAGSDHYGFWFSLEKRVTGASAALPQAARVAARA